MPEKINIADLKVELFAEKTVKAYTKALADADTVLGLGSAAAEAAANSAALALLAVNKTESDDADMITAAKDLETLRTYFLHLIDEENKAKLPLEKRLASNAPAAEIEAGYRTACAIVDEVLFAVIKVLEVLDNIKDKLCPCTGSVAAGSVFFAKTAMDCVRLQLAMYSTKLNEEVYARTTRREPEIAIEQNTALINGLLEKFEGMIK